MAYREFYKPIEAQPIDYSPLERGLTNFFSAISQGYNKRKSLSDQYNYSLDYGQFQNDNNFNTEYAKYVTQLGKRDYKTSGTPSADLLNAERQGKQYVADQKAQYERFKKLNDQIDKRGTEDKYYDPNFDKRSLEVAAFGEDGEVNFFSRGERLNNIAGMIGNDPRSFKSSMYTQDWLQTLGEKQILKTTDNPDAKNTLESKSRLWDPASGKQGATDDHAIDFMRSDPRVSGHYDWLLDQQLSKEIDQMKASGNADWMKGRSIPEIKNILVNNPSLNTVNSTEYGARKRELAKADLNRADDTYSKVSYEKKSDDSKTGGLYKNDAIAYSPTFYNTQIGQGGVDPGVSEASGINQLSAPGGLLVISKGLTTGKPISMNTEGRFMFNLTNGRKAQITGRQPFNLTGYQLQAYTTDGTPFPLKAGNMQELKAKLDAMRPFEFKNLQKELSIGLNGYSVDKTSILGDIAKNQYTLEGALGKATREGNQTEMNNIQTQLDLINEFKQALNDPDSYSDQDILNLAARNGISQVRQDLMVKASGSDLDWINNVTSGLNLRNQDKWSEDMRTFNTWYKEAYKKAEAAGFGESPEQKFEKAVSTKKPVSTELKSSYEANGQSYSLDDLRSMGYNDDQIRQAIKLGTLK